MVCDRKFYRSHLVMAHHVGAFSGMIITTLFADIFGRKLVFCLSNIGLFAANIALPWVQNYYVIMFLRYLNGLSGIVSYVSGFILVIEMVKPSKRMIVGCAISWIYMSGAYILDLIAYFARDWHDLVLYTSAPIGLNLLSWFVIPESPRWLIVKKKLSKAVKMLNKMADVNGAKVQYDTDSIACIIDKKHQTSFSKSVKILITSKQLFIRTCILLFNWFAVNLAYYGITMNVGKLGGDVYVNVAISVTVGFLGEIVCLFASYKIGRNRLYMFYMIVGGIGCLLTLLPSLFGQKSLHFLLVAMFMLGKLTFNGAFLLLYLYTAEVAPTVTRGFFLSLCSGAGKIGSMSSSYIGDLGLLLDTKFGRALPIIIFGAVGLTAGILCVFLPETKDTILPDTVEDAAKLGRVVDNNEAEEDLEERSRDDDNNDFKLLDKKRNDDNKM
ncbi:solute carrier family 22 member 3-like isoform X2 [Mytilus californianus]|nr:solute carrier family 22 member 3-like isoform X2 [Mytilus californianus]XP_052092919.1 solute carrier family 22 member 3-like isoform X2 [Mytilus californianus]